MPLNNRQLVRDHDLESVYPVSVFGPLANGYFLIYSEVSGKWTNQPNDGWFPIPSVTPLYRTTGSFNVPGNYTGSFAKGNYIKWEQTTTKYGAVLSSTYTSGTVTTVNIIGNQDYQIANAAISGLSFSVAANPLGFPDWFNYIPNLSWTAGTPITGFTISNSIYKTIGNLCSVQYFWNGVAGATVTGVNILIPVNASPSNQDASGFLGIGVNPNPTHADIATNLLRLQCSSLSASRFHASATYKW